MAKLIASLCRLRSPLKKPMFGRGGSRLCFQWCALLTIQNSVRVLSAVMCALVLIGPGASLVQARDAQPIAATSSNEAVVPVAQGTPYVPRYQGPYGSGRSVWNQNTWGFTLLGAGALSGGLGLLLLESDPSASPRSVQFGTGLLVAGVFMSGLGL